MDCILLTFGVLCCLVHVFGRASPQVVDVKDVGCIIKEFQRNVTIEDGKLLRLSCPTNCPVVWLFADTEDGERREVVSDFDNPPYFYILDISAHHDGWYWCRVDGGSEVIEASVFVDVVGVETQAEKTMSTTTEDIMSTTTEEIISTTTEEIMSTTPEKIMSTTTEEIMSTTTEEIISTTTEEIMSTTAEEIMSTTKEEIMSITEAPFKLVGITEIVDELETSIKLIEEDTMTAAEEVPTPMTKKEETISTISDVAKLVAKHLQPIYRQLADIRERLEYIEQKLDTQA